MQFARMVQINDVNHTDCPVIKLLAEVMQFARTLQIARMMQFAPPMQVCRAASEVHRNIARDLPKNRSALLENRSAL